MRVLQFIIYENMCKVTLSSRKEHFRKGDFEINVGGRPDWGPKHHKTDAIKPVGGEKYDHYVKPVLVEPNLHSYIKKQNFSMLFRSFIMIVDRDRSSDSREDRLELCALLFKVSLLDVGISISENLNY